ncbi:MAG: Fic family protein [Bdellovibrionales bacterium]
MNIVEKLDISSIKSIHKSIMSEGANSTYRVEPVYCVSRDNRKIVFTSPELIESKLDSLLGLFNTYLTEVKNTKDLSKVLGIFWVGFISIHPFSDGNGRTAKKIIKSYTGLASLNFLDQYLIEGNAKSDIQALSNQFYNQLSHIGEKV